MFWDLWLLGVVVLLGRELAVWRTPADFPLRPRWAPLWVIPLVVVLNGLSPYVGLKTETSWAMYSNLRTEVHPNHFVVPASAKLFGYQDDLVEILATSLPALQEYVGGDVRLTFFEFRRICGAATNDFAVSYRRNGEVRTLDPATCRPHPGSSASSSAFAPSTWVRTRAAGTRDEGDAPSEASSLDWRRIWRRGWEIVRDEGGERWRSWCSRTSAMAASSYSSAGSTSRSRRSRRA